MNWFFRLSNRAVLLGALGLIVALLVIVTYQHQAEKPTKAEKREMRSLSLCRSIVEQEGELASFNSYSWGDYREATIERTDRGDRPDLYSVRSSVTVETPVGSKQLSFHCKLEFEPGQELALTDLSIDELDK